MGQEWPHDVRQPPSRRHAARAHRGPGRQSGFGRVDGKVSPGSWRMFMGYLGRGTGLSEQPHNCLHRECS